MATFGIAALLMNNPLAGQGASPKGARSRAGGHRAGPPHRREDAARARLHRGGGRLLRRLRQQARARSPGRAGAGVRGAGRAAIPDDDEAQIFAALYTAGTQSQADQTYAAYLKAAAVLEKQFVKYPDHPGVAHYLIHSYDAPPIASKGLPAARRYADIAPDAPHALHMPSHIFTRVGAWQDSVVDQPSLRRRRQEGRQLATRPTTLPTTWCTRSCSSDATRPRGSVLEEFKREGRRNPAVFVGPYAAVAIPARYGSRARRLACRGAAAEPAEHASSPSAKRSRTFSRALGAARTGDVAAAEQEAQRLEAQHKALLDAKNTYWATEVEVQRLAAAAWIAQARGQRDEAKRLMRAAADLEDRNEKHIVTPGRVVPARELLGEMLLELKQPAAALKEFEQSQVREPNRLRGYAGAAAAAEAAGEREKARQHHAKLVELTRDADTPAARDCPREALPRCAVSLRAALSPAARSWSARRAGRARRWRRSTPWPP